MPPRRMRHIPLEDREALKYALGASLVKSSSHWRAFETAFEIYFSLRGPSTASTTTATAGRRRRRRRTSGDRGRQGSGPGQAERAAGGHDPRGAGRPAVQGPARRPTTPWSPPWPARPWPATPAWRPGRPVGGTYYLYRTLRNLDLDAVLERLMEQARTSAGRIGQTDGGPAAPRASPPWRSACCATSTRPGSTSCARRSRTRSAGGWWPTGVARRWPSRCASPCPRTSTSCTPPGTSWWRCARPSSPLSRKLAVRLARKRRHGRKGPLDFRTHGAPLAVHRRGARSTRVPLPAPVQARDRGHRRHLRLGGLASPASPSISSTPSAPSSPRCAASCSSTASTR